MARAPGQDARRCALWALLVGLLAAPCAPPVWPRHRVVYSNALSGRYDPWGGEDRIELEYRLRLFDSKSVLWNGTFLGLGLTPTVTPFMTRAGATLTVRPISIASVAVAYNYVFWYGALGHVQAFASPGDDYSDTALGRGEGRALATTGHELVLRGNLSAKLGPLALSDVAEFTYARTDLEGRGGYTYNPRVDALVANPGWLVTNDTDLVFVTRVGLVLGARNSLVHAFGVTGGGAAERDTPTDRLGPLLAYVFFFELGDLNSFAWPTSFLTVGWWLAHRFRTGEDVSQAIPCVTLGFKFEGEIWGSRD